MASASQQGHRTRRLCAALGSVITTARYTALPNEDDARQHIENAQDGG
jgi:hypothetical protein